MELTCLCHATLVSHTWHAVHHCLLQTSHIDNFKWSTKKRLSNALHQPQTFLFVVFLLLMLRAIITHLCLLLHHDFFSVYCCESKHVSMINFHGYPCYLLATFHVTQNSQVNYLSFKSTHVPSLDPTRKKT